MKQMKADNKTEEWNLKSLVINSSTFNVHSYYSGEKCLLQITMLFNIRTQALTPITNSLMLCIDNQEKILH